MAKKQKKVTESTIPVVGLLCGVDIITAYDTESSRFLSTSDNGISTDAYDRIVDGIQTRLSFHDVERYTELCRQHCQKLIDIGYAIRRSVFKKLDAIDLSALPVKRGAKGVMLPTFCLLDDREYREHIVAMVDGQPSECATMDHLLCAMVPPFTCFGMRVSKGRYIHVEVSEIDMVSHSITVSAHDYTVKPEKINWIPGASCIARVSLQRMHPGSRFDIASYALEIELLHGADPHDINVMVPYDMLGWSRNDIRIWETVDQGYTKPVMDNLASIGRSSCIELVKFVLLGCSVSNYMLYRNRPVIQKTDRTEKKHVHVKGEAARPEAPAPERRVRDVGLVSMRSVASPKRATPDTVRKWKVASWKARGGVRTMKDGRLVPFKESIRHRKALMGQEGAVPPVTLRMKDNRPDGAE